MIKRVFILFLFVFLMPLSVFSAQIGMPFSIPFDPAFPNPFNPAPQEHVENSFLFKDGIVYISGNTDKVLLENFLSLDISKIHTVSFRSHGGLTSTAIAIAAIIHKNNIETLITKGNFCYSSCALMFQAGSVRIVHQSAYLMYHVVSMPSSDNQKMVPTLNGSLIFYLELIKYGFPREIAYQIDAYVIIYVSAQVALKMGIATYMISDNSISIDSVNELIIKNTQTKTQPEIQPEIE